jgi:hypothetical protein
MIAQDELVKNLFDGKVMLADLGYVGDPNFWTPVKFPRVQEERNTIQLHHSKRQVIERVNNRLKNFRSISGTWRHDNIFLSHLLQCHSKSLNVIFKYKN